MKAMQSDNLVAESNKFIEDNHESCRYFLFHIRYYRSDLLALAKAKSEFMSDIKDLGELERLDLNSIFVEAFKNALEHGNRFDGRKNICVKVYRSASEIRVDVEDEGKGWDKKTNDYLFNSNKIGLRLIHSLADEVSFASSGRKIVFTKYISELPRPGEYCE